AWRCSGATTRPSAQCICCWSPLPAMPPFVTTWGNWSSSAAIPMPRVPNGCAQWSLATRALASPWRACRENFLRRVDDRSARMVFAGRILHVTPFYEKAWAYGGIPRVVASLAHGQAERGHDVTVCTTDAFESERRLPDEWKRGDEVHLRVFRNL